MGMCLRVGKTDWNLLQRHLIRIMSNCNVEVDAQFCTYLSRPRAASARWPRAPSLASTFPRPISPGEGAYNLTLSTYIGRGIGLSFSS